MNAADDDCLLLEQFTREHSQHAFRALVTRYVPTVYHSALRQVRDVHIAEDVTQAVFILLARKAAGFGDGVYLAAWLLRTTHYASCNAMREQTRRRQAEREAAAMTPIATNDSWESLSPVIDEAINKLGRADRELIAMRFVEGLDAPEISTRMGITHAASRKRISRALERLREILKREGVAASTPFLGGLGASTFAPPVAEHVMASALQSSISESVEFIVRETARSMRPIFIPLAMAACVIIALLVAGFAVLRMPASGPIASAAAPATSQASSPLLARAELAIQNSRSFHLTGHRSWKGDPDRAIEAWGQFHPDKIAFNTITPKRTHTFLADGAAEWMYSTPGEVLGKRAQTAQPLAVEHFEIILDWYRYKLLPAPDRSRNGDSSTLEAFTLEDWRDPVIVWIDASSRIRQIEMGDPGSPHTVASIDWDVPTPPDCFKPSPPAGARALDPEKYLGEQYPLTPQTQTMNFSGLTAAVHRFERGENGLIYLVFSSHLNDETRAALGPIALREGRTVGSTIILPRHDGEDPGPWRSCPVAMLRLNDVSVIYMVLVPFKPTNATTPCPLVAEGRIRSRLQDYLHEHKIEPRRTNAPFKLIANPNPQSLKDFVNEAFAAVDKVNCMIDGEGMIGTWPKPGFDFREPWATTPEEVNDELVQTLRDWSNGYWK